MSDKQKNISKIKALIAPTIYFVLTILIAVNVLIVFNRSYYLVIYIEGKSMQPTLNGEVTSSYTDEDGAIVTEHIEFGYTDESKSAIDSVQRFNIVTCLYPWDRLDYSRDENDQYVRNSSALSTANYKIKRVIAFPNETFKIEGEEEGTKGYNLSFYVDTDNDGEKDTWEAVELPFDTTGLSAKYIPETTLGEDEYWVMGDNWGNSTDCSSHSYSYYEYDDEGTLVTKTQTMGPIYYENITGVLVAIEGECTLKEQNGETSFVDRTYYSNPIYYF